MDMKNINFNMHLGKAKPIKKDINLFAVYRNKSHMGNSDLKGIVICAVCFALVLGLGFGGLKLATGILRGQTDTIYQELNDPQLQATLDTVNNEVTKNSLLLSYINLMKNAGTAFDEMNKPDFAFFSAIAKATPDDVTVINMSVAPAELVLSCQTTVFIDPSLYIQQLEKTDYFAHLSFNDVVYDAKENLYTFSVTGVF